MKVMNTGSAGDGIIEICIVYSRGRITVINFGVDDRGSNGTGG